jgi:CheY-like chemotaxis protein
MPKPTMNTQTVLLVEDEPEISEMLTFALNRAGFATRAAGSAEEALKMPAHSSLIGCCPVQVVSNSLAGSAAMNCSRICR